MESKSATGSHVSPTRDYKADFEGDATYTEDNTFQDAQDMRRLGNQQELKVLQTPSITVMEASRLVHCSILIQIPENFPFAGGFGPHEYPCTNMDWRNVVRLNTGRLYLPCCTKFGISGISYSLINGGCAVSLPCSSIRGKT